MLTIFYGSRKVILSIKHKLNLKFIMQSLVRVGSFEQGGNDVEDLLSGTKRNKNFINF
jgi:hypothetical protein